MPDAQVIQYVSSTLLVLLGACLCAFIYCVYRLIHIAKSPLSPAGNNEILGIVPKITVNTPPKDTLEQKIIQNIVQRAKEDRILWERDGTYDKYNIKGNDLDSPLLYSMTLSIPDYVHFRTYDRLPNGSRGDETLGIHIHPMKELLTLWVMVAEKVGGFPSEEDEYRNALCSVAKTLGVEEDECP